MINNTYCCNGNCPFKDCNKHLSQLLKLKREGTVNVASLDGVCKRYIGYLVDEICGQSGFEL